MTRRPFDVAIVGLGPTGATLANLCGRRGLRTVVYERSTDPYPLPRACHLDAEVARVFQGLGFADELADLLTVSAGMEYVDAAGQRLFTFEGFEREPLLGWHEDYVFVQPEIDMMLRRGIERYPCVDVRLGTPAPALADLLAEATFVVAADGATSDIRRSLGIRNVDLGFDEDWLVVDVMVDADDDDDDNDTTTSTTTGWRCRRSSSRCAIRIGRRRSCRRTVAIGGGSSASRRVSRSIPGHCSPPGGSARTGPSSFGRRRTVSTPSSPSGGGAAPTAGSSSPAMPLTRCRRSWARACARACVTR